MQRRKLERCDTRHAYTSFLVICGPCADQMTAEWLQQLVSTFLHEKGLEPKLLKTTKKQDALWAAVTLPKKSNVGKLRKIILQNAQMNMTSPQFGAPYCCLWHTPRGAARSGVTTSDEVAAFVSGETEHDYEMLIDSLTAPAGSDPPQPHQIFVNSMLPLITVVCLVVNICVQWQQPPSMGSVARRLFQLQQDTPQHMVHQQLRGVTELAAALRDCACRSTCEPCAAQGSCESKCEVLCSACPTEELYSQLRKAAAARDESLTVGMYHRVTEPRGLKTRNELGEQQGVIPRGYRFVVEELRTSEQLGGLFAEGALARRVFGRSGEEWLALTEQGGVQAGLNVAKDEL